MILYLSINLLDLLEATLTSITIDFNIVELISIIINYKW
jgi:hypothetical protein